jgi:hypothetical protein
MITDLLIKIPDDVINHYIYPFLPPTTLLWTNKKYYEKYHYLVEEMISKEDYNNYIRDIIRNDCGYVFQQILNEKIHKWCDKQKIFYKNNIYLNYLSYVYGICVENNSSKCKDILSRSMEEAGLSKNWYKKNISKNNRWSN